MKKLEKRKSEKTWKEHGVICYLFIFFNVYIYDLLNQ